MAKSDELKKLRNRYKDCLDYVQHTADSLQKSISALQTLIGTQEFCYSVNDVSGGSNYLDHLLEEEQGIYSNIVENIIPGTKYKISNLDRKIREALEDE